jgi:DNA primase
MQDVVQRIKDRLSIVDVVGQYVRLDKAGRNFKGLSPFKKEKTASFYVSPDKGMYYDFSSNQGGDIFSFVQIMEGLDFRGALRLLADRAGVELPREGGAQTKSVRDRAYALLEEATAFFETRLADNESARTYLANRGLTPFTMRAFRIGFAPEAWRETSEFLQKRGFSPAELELVGLTKKPERGGAPYDRFRSRIMFPIADPSGRVVGFSGRIFGEAAENSANAKYINSPETPLFDKSALLYGFDKAKQGMRTFHCAILVEGQMDLVLSHQAGYVNTVASSGTALTDTHLARIASLTHNLVLALDADSAGQASTERVAHLALVRGMEVKVARVPLGKDPADCIRENPDAWKHAVGNAELVVPFFLTQILGATTDPHMRAREIRERVVPFVARMKSGVEQAHFVRNIADALGMMQDAPVWDDVRKEARALAEKARKEKQGVEGVVQKETPFVQQKPREYSRRERLERELVGVLFWQDGLEKKDPALDGFCERAQALGVVVEPLLARFAEERDALALCAELSFSEKRDFAEHLSEILDELVKEVRTTERARLHGALKKAEQGGDEKEIEERLRDFQEYLKREGAR